MKFMLNGCDIWLVAEAPDDITLKQLIEQTDKIKTYWCACGICSLEYADYPKDAEPEVIIGYDSIKCTEEGESKCYIKEDKS